MKIKEGIVAFITGGASGLGEDMACKLHSLGASIVVADINTKAMQQLHSDLQTRILCLHCDVTKESEVSCAILKAVQIFGAVHIAIPCAGIIIRDRTLTKKRSMNLKLFKRLMDINVFGTVYVAKHAAMAMAKNDRVDGERGVILLVSSLAAEDSASGAVAYGASKAAVNGMVLPMARDLGKYDIRVAALQPAYFHTPMVDSTQGKLPQSLLMRTTPMGRFGQAHECSHLAVSMIENSYVNGVAIRIDGATVGPHI